MAPKPNPVRVLVVDDDEMSRELLGVLLAAEGYAVQSADSGESALALLRQGGEAFDLVLTDMQMPGTTGSSLAGKLRRACGSQTLLLAMSGSRPPDKATARFDGFLMKPFKMQELAKALAAQSRASADTPKVVVAAGAHRRQPASKKSMNLSVHDAPPSVFGSGGSSASKPILNETIYGQLAGSMPAPQLLEMYTMCVNDARKRIASMRSLAEAHDAATFVREAHSIKGGCGMLGATELHGMAAELEKKGLEPGASEVNSLDELSAACDRLERMLRSRV
jgi:CheY-like chemotaxis protein/HPt (histidine-containing phosphotransfer) domain-containing protein